MHGVDALGHAGGIVTSHATVGSLLALALAVGGCALGRGPNVRGGDAELPGLDAGPLRDAGAPELDAGRGNDASVIDAGPLDAGPLDAGPFDAGLPDAGCELETCNALDDDCDGTIDEDAACPCAVEHRGDHTYLFCPARQDWPTASLGCETYGYGLAVVDDAAEDAFLYAAMDARSFASSWVGLNDRQSEGQWVWLDGLPLVYEHWDEGEPNDGGGEDCGVIMRESGRESEWDDRDCDDERPSICETPAL